MGRALFSTPYTFLTEASYIQLKKTKYYINALKIRRGAFILLSCPDYNFFFFFEDITICGKSKTKVVFINILSLKTKILQYQANPLPNNSCEVNC